MSDPQQIEKDLQEYLDKEPNLKRADRLAYLQLIFHKHLEIDKLDHVVTSNDLFLIFAQASKNWVRNKLPITIGKNKLDLTEGVHMAVLESFIGYLNQKKLLRKLVKFDYQD